MLEKFLTDLAKSAALKGVESIHKSHVDRKEQKRWDLIAEERRAWKARLTPEQLVQVQAEEALTLAKAEREHRRWGFWDNIKDRIAQMGCLLVLLWPLWLFLFYALAGLIRDFAK